jgi:peptidoglycan pentaglycine glycine transferase (the first glycine)
MALELKTIDQEKEWERFLQTHSPQALFQSWYWGEIEKKTGTLVYRFGVYDGATLVGLAQIFVIRAKRGTFFHIRQGPVWARDGHDYWKDFVRLISPIARVEGAWFIRMSPLVANSEENNERMRHLGMKHSPIHEVDAERCWVLDIDKSEEELLMGMRKTTRYEIRLAQKSDVTIKKTTDLKDLRHFYELYEETSKRHGFVAHSAITEEFEVFTKAGKALLFLGYHEKQLIAATIVLFYGGQAIYHHGASRASKIPVSHLVQWEAIAEAKKRGIKLYNFYGIAPEDNPNHPWRGITLFKKGFGGREINYMHAHDLPLSPLYIIPKSIEAIRKKMRGY